MKLRPVVSALAALFGAAALALGGCASSPGSAGQSGATAVELPPLAEVEPLADPTTYVGPTTAIVGGPTIAPLADPPSPQLPATVTSESAQGTREVTVESVDRVVVLSLTGSVGELVYAYGMKDNIVGRDISTNFPGADDIPIVTREGHSVDAESIMALNPTLILTDGTVGPADVVLQMQDAGVPVVTVTRAVNPQTSYAAAAQIADALGIPAAAPQLVAELEAAIAAKETEVAALVPADETKIPRVAFLYVRGTAGIFYLFGEGSGIDSTIESLGAIDAAKEIGWAGEKPMTEEALIAMDPDVIIVMTKGLESAGGVDGLLAAQPSVALTSAGQNRRIIDVDDGVIFAGGTRIPDVIDGLARALYAPDSLADANTNGN